jgi:hypothetical protein
VRDENTFPPERKRICGIRNSFCRRWSCRALHAARPPLVEERVNEIEERYQFAVAGILANEPEVKQLQVDRPVRKIDVGYYAPPSPELYQRIKKPYELTTHLPHSTVTLDT